METFSIILYIEVKISKLKQDLEKQSKFVILIFILIYLWAICFFDYMFFVMVGWLHFKERSNL